MIIRSITDRLKRQLLRSEEVAGPDTDPGFYANLQWLPNPDPILRKASKDASVYQSILYDPSVMGDVQMLRSQLLSYERRLNIGGEQPADQQAYDFLQDYLNQTPATGLSWDELYWNIYVAVLHGQRIHEIGWQLVDDRYYLPAFIKDRPARRFGYTIGNELRCLSRDHPIHGEAIELDYRFLITRHMADQGNPYGVAVMSACFWPYTFKNMGWRGFVNFCRKCGIPQIVGRYPQGTGEDKVEELVANLAELISNSVSAVPEGTGIEVLDMKGAGQRSPHEREILLANLEMTKALTTQAIAGQQQENGSRAAAETGQTMTEVISSANRNLVSATINQLLAWITELNFSGATPPKHEFYQQEQPPTAWVDTLTKAASLAPVSTTFFRTMTKIPAPENEADQLRITAQPSPPAPSAQYARASLMQEPVLSLVPDIEQLQSQAQTLLNPVLIAAENLVKSGASAQQALPALQQAFPDENLSALQDYLERAMLIAELEGQMDVQNDIAAQHV